MQIINANAVSFITDENLTGEALINSYQERMQDLRDIYQSIRADQARLDRRWRKTLEKRSNDFCLTIILKARRQVFIPQHFIDTRVFPFRSYLVIEKNFSRSKLVQLTERCCEKHNRKNHCENIERLCKWFSTIFVLFTGLLFNLLAFYIYQFFSKEQRDKEHRKKDEPFVQSPVSENIV